MRLNTKTLATLLATTFMTAPAWAVEAVSDIDADYLNSLTDPKITWSDSEGTELKVGDQTFYYTYTMPEGYEETSTRLVELTSEEDVTDKLFKDSNIQTTSPTGGAIYIGGQDYGNINILSDFIGNYASGEYGYASGGAIDAYNTSFGDITGDFIGNYAEAGAEYRDSIGGAINIGADNSAEVIVGNITGNFIGNYVTGHGMQWGGAIANNGFMTFGNITGDFIGNYAVGGMAWGGAIWTQASSFGDVIGNFIGNYAISEGGSALGGAIMTTEDHWGNITGNFIGNYAISKSTGEYSSDAKGGAICASVSTLNLINSSFIDNYVESSGNAYGGAIYFSYYDLTSFPELNITADNGTSLFEGNKANGKSNAIYMAYESREQENYADLNLSAINGGIITFNDNINGGRDNDNWELYDADSYNLNIYGDGSGEVQFNALVEHAINFGLGKNSVTHLGINGEINAQTMSVVASNLIGRADDTDTRPTITVDVEVDKANNTVTAGQINIAGDIEGDYHVLVNSLNPDVLDNLDDAVVPFLFAPNDSENTSSSFSIARVIGSPYLWDGDVNARGETEGSTWYLNLTDEENPDYEPEPGPEPEPEPEPEVLTPEVVAALGLHEAAIEQTRSVVRNVRNKTAATRGYCEGCGNYPNAWDSKTLHNAWVLAQGETANIEKPVDMDADIWGVEAGFDIQNDVNDTLGVFASYRDGEYDLSGKTSRYARTTGSEIDINSWLGGLYYRYDRNMNWLFATVYGGVQKAEAKTDDGIAKFKTDGVELGASVEAGHTFALTNSLTLDPSLGVFYTQVDFDKAHDNVGKEYNWKNIKHAEAELGAKLTKQFDNAKVYVKPSVIQTLTGSDKVTITGLGKADTYHDQTLGRIEIGGDYNFNEALTAYAWANYTFGSSYDAFAGGVGLNYAW